MSRREKKHSRKRLSFCQSDNTAPITLQAQLRPQILFFEILKGNPALVKQILPPLIIRMPHQAHDVAAGVEIEGARFSRRLHIGFVRQLIALTAVAGMAARDKIFPSR
jgi:hypothetical protein